MAERTSGDHGAIAYWACCQGTALKSHLAHGPRPYKDDLQKTVSRLHGNICSSKALVLFLLENHSLWSRWAPGASGREALHASVQTWLDHTSPSLSALPSPQLHTQGLPPLSSGQQPASHCFRPFSPVATPSCPQQLSLPKALTAQPRTGSKLTSSQRPPQMDLLGPLPWIPWP